MSYSQSNKVTNLANIPSKTAPPENMGVVSSFTWTPEAFEIADSATAILEATWTTAIKQVNDRIYKLPIVRDGESQNEEDVFFEYPTSGGSVKTKDGRLKIRAMFDVPYKTAKNIMKFDGIEGRVFVNYTNNFIKGASEDGTKFLGFRARMYVESQNWNLDATPEMVPIMIEFLDSKTDFYEYAQYVEPTAFNVEDLDSLTDLDLAETGTTTAISLTIDVTNFLTGGGVTGLVLADFSITGTGTLSSVTDNGDGTYTFVTVGLINGDVVDLVAADNISIDGFWESSGSVTVAGI